MPIKVTCQCGQSFAAKDELAGKTVKCPKCTKPLRIPETGPRVSAPPQRPAPTAAGAGQRTTGAAGGPASALGAPLPSAGSGGSLFDEAGLSQSVAGTTPCPGCTAPLPPTAVICVKCGYNRRLGRRMETVRMTAAPLAGGHDATAQELLDRAARRMEEDKEEERKKTREGMPWWGYLIGLSCILGFMITMMVLPTKVALLTGGTMMWVATLAIFFYAEVRLAIIAFSEGALQGVMFLICGPYQLFFIFTNWDQCGGYVLMSVAANVANALVQFAIIAGLGSEEEEDAWRYVPRETPAYVAKCELDGYAPPKLINQRV